MLFCIFFIFVIVNKISYNIDTSFQQYNYPIGKSPQVNQQQGESITHSGLNETKHRMSELFKIVMYSFLCM